MRALLADYNEPGDERYHDTGFVKLLQDHKQYIKDHEGTNVVPLEPAFSYKWKGDFFGMLNELNVRPQYYRVHLLVNDLASPSDWDGETDIVVNVSSNLIDSLLTTYASRKA